MELANIRPSFSVLVSSSNRLLTDVLPLLPNAATEATDFASVLCFYLNEIKKP